MTNQVPLGQYGIDLEYLNRNKREGKSPWPVSWRIACETLYVNGFTPKQVRAMLGENSPPVTVIAEWSAEGDWTEKRDKFKEDLARRVLNNSADSQAAVISRHLKQIRAAQGKLMGAIANPDATKNVEAKSLEGAVAALVQLVRLERSILNLENDQTNITVNDNRVQTLVGQLDIPEDRREEWFEAQRRKFQAEEELSRIQQTEGKENVQSA